MHLQILKNIILKSSSSGKKYNCHQVHQLYYTCLYLPWSKPLFWMVWVIEHCHSGERQWKSWLDFFPAKHARTTEISNFHESQQKQHAFINIGTFNYISEQYLTEPVIEHCHSRERQWKSWLDFFSAKHARTTLPISLTMVKSKEVTQEYMVFGLCPHI